MPVPVAAGLRSTAALFVAELWRTMEAPGSHASASTGWRAARWLARGKTW